MSRVPKTDPRIEAYGTVDELNAHVGVALALPDLPEALRAAGCGASRTTSSTSAPTSASRSTNGRSERLRVRPEQTTWLEARCDEVNADLPPLKSFVLPGGTPGRRAAARLPHGLPPRRAPRDRLRRRGQPRVRSATSTALGPALHPLAGRNGADEPLWQPGGDGA